MLVYTDILVGPAGDDGDVVAGIGRGDLPDIMASSTGFLTNNVWSISQNWDNRHRWRINGGRSRHGFRRAGRRRAK